MDGFERFTFGVGCLALIFYLAMWAAIIFVIVHFTTKYW